MSQRHTAPPSRRRHMVVGAYRQLRHRPSPFARFSIRFDSQRPRDWPPPSSASRGAAARCRARACSFFSRTAPLAHGPPAKPALVKITIQKSCRRRSVARSARAIEDSRSATRFRAGEMAKAQHVPMRPRMVAPTARRYVAGPVRDHRPTDPLVEIAPDPAKRT